MAAIRAGLAVVCAAVASCGAPRDEAPRPPAPGEERAFEGAWTAAGQRQTLALGADRRVSVASLSGSLLLTVDGGLGVGFQARAITFSDSGTGNLGRFVWTDQRGDQVFGELQGGAADTGRHVTGTITGGTGRYAGLSGELSFDWQYVIEAEDGAVQGRAVNLKGRVRRGGGAGAAP
jgi:hypothetical protein